MGYLENIFSEDNVMGYSNVCIDLAVNIPESRKAERSRNFDTLLIPSRGAFPFFLGMIYSLNKLKSFGGDQEEFYKNLGVQDMISSLLPENLKFNGGDLNGKSIRTLLIPFTADLNIPKFDPNVDNDEFIFKTRKYWTNVTASFFKEPNKRKKDPYFSSFVDFILRDIEGREKLAEKYESFPKINCFSLIDTVISGRASNNILMSFEKIAKKEKNPYFNPSAFLVVDEMGKKLKPRYAQYLHRRELEGLDNIYRIPRIVSEDEGASLLGVEAVVYPSVMKISKHFKDGDNEFFIGAGGWHKSSDLPGNYFENFKSFMNMIYKGIDLIYIREYLGKEGKIEQDNFERSRKSFLNRAREGKILSQTCGDINILNCSSNYSYGECYETSSHVLHAPFEPSSEGRVYSKIGSFPNIKAIDQEKILNKI